MWGFFKKLWETINHFLKSFFEPKPLILTYEKSYPLSTPTVEETLENINRKHVQEVTPEGLVTMSYDENSNTFFYWSEKKVQYKYLEVVARKYVILYDCRDLYINMFRELLKSMHTRRRFVNEKSNTYKYKGVRYEEEVPLLHKRITYSDYKKNNYTL